jgi:hypothetical protein
MQQAIKIFYAFVMILYSYPLLEREAEQHGTGQMSVLKE